MSAKFAGVLTPAWTRLGLIFSATRNLPFGATLPPLVRTSFMGGPKWKPQTSNTRTQPIQVSEAISAQLGFQTEEQARERVVQTLITFTTSWPREPNHGFLVHFSNRDFEALSEFSTIDTAELVLGAMFAGTW